MENQRNQPTRHPLQQPWWLRGKKEVVIGLARQLIGLHEFGATGYGRCGNILPLPMEYDKSSYVLDGVEKMVSL